MPHALLVEKASLLPDALADGGVQGRGLVLSSQGAAEAPPRPSRSSGGRSLTSSGRRTPDFSIRHHKPARVTKPFVERHMSVPGRWPWALQLPLQVPPPRTMWGAGRPQMAIQGEARGLCGGARSLPSTRGARLGLAGLMDIDSGHHASPTTTEPSRNLTRPRWAETSSKITAHHTGISMLIKHLL